MALSRRSHPKSRLGCKTCKSRKVKCDEQKPECRNCVKHNVPCDFLESSKLSTPTPAPSNGTGLNMADLELLHQFTTYTYTTLTDDMSLRDYYRINIVQIGLKHEYIMRTVLSVAALHVAHHRKQSYDYYLSLSTAHHDAATRTATELMKNVNQENAAMLFLFSNLTMFFALGAPRQVSDFLLVGESGFPDWMFLLRGSRLFLSYLTEESKNGEVAPLLHHGRQCWVAMFSNRLADGDPAKKHLDKITDEIKDEIAAAVREVETGDRPDKEAAIRTLQHNQDAYMEAISKMDPALAYSQKLGGRATDGLLMRMAFTWLFEVTDGLLPLLQTSPTPPKAAVLLAFFAVLLHKAPNQWWQQGWSEHLIGRIYALLDETHRIWIRWPMEEMGWIPPS